MDHPDVTEGQQQPQPGPEVYGAAAERTGLAWQRTGLGVIVGSLLLFRTSVDLGVMPVGLAAVALGLVVAALSVFAFPSERYQRGNPADSWRLLSVVSGAVVALGLFGLALAVLVLLVR